MSKHSDGEQIPKLSPESKRLLLAGFQWLYIGSACGVIGMISAVAMMKLFLPDIRQSYAAIMILLSSLPGWAILFGKGARYNIRSIRVQQEHRKRHSLREDNVILEFGAAHPFWFTITLIIIACTVIYVLGSLG